MKTKYQPFKIGDVVQFLSRGDIEEDVDIGVVTAQTRFPQGSDEEAWDVYFFEMERTFTIYHREMILISRAEHEQEKEKT
jgi:hypothetical protein